MRREVGGGEAEVGEAGGGNGLCRPTAQLANIGH